MLLRIVRAPFVAIRKVMRVFTGGGTTPPPAPRPADTWELRHAERARTAEGPTTDPAVTPTKRVVPAEAAPVAEAPKPAPKTKRPASKSKPKPRPKLAITFQETPNPNASKFQFSKAEFATGGFSCASAAEATTSPVAMALFALDGVRSVFAVNDFVTVTKDPAVSWDQLAPAVEAALQTSLRPTS